MARGENCPVQRGATAYQGGTIDTADLLYTNLEGTEWEWEDIDLSTTTQGAKGNRTNNMVITKLVRNVGAVALLPKQLVTFQASGVYFLGRVDGKANITGEFPHGVIDEYLASAGCPVNDMCHVVIQGPTMMLTDLAGADNNVIEVGTVLVALTAATSGATTAGRVKPQDLTGATAVLGAEIQGVIGQALSAKTTTNTNADVLVNMVRRWA